MEFNVTQSICISIQYVKTVFLPIVTFYLTCIIRCYIGIHIYILFLIFIIFIMPGLPRMLYMKCPIPVIQVF